MWADLECAYIGRLVSLQGGRLALVGVSETEHERREWLACVLARFSSILLTGSWWHWPSFLQTCNFSASQDDSPVLWRCRHSVSTKRAYTSNLQDIRVKKRTQHSSPQKFRAMMLGRLTERNVTCVIPWLVSCWIWRCVRREKKLRLRKFRQYSCAWLFSFKVFVEDGVVGAGDL